MEQFLASHAMTITERLENREDYDTNEYCASCQDLGDVTSIGDTLSIVGDVVFRTAMGNHAGASGSGLRKPGLSWVGVIA